ncbi:GNAT family N-acetyltransferase [Dermacoccaceae bacterium W4C1]
MTMQIAPIRPDQHDAAAEVIASAFEDRSVVRMVEGIRASDLYWPGCERIAVDGEQVIGHVMVSGTTLRSDTGDRVVAMLTPLAVLPQRQRSGIGTALIGAVLEAARARSEPLVVLEGSPTFYGARGFTSAGAAGISIDLPDWAPPEAAQVAILPEYDPGDPSLRGRIVYPASVAQLSE